MPEVTKDVTARMRVEADDAQPIDEIEESLRSLDAAGKEASGGLEKAGASARETRGRLGRLKESVRGVAEGFRTGARGVKEFVSVSKGLDRITGLLGKIRGSIARIGAIDLLSRAKTLLFATVEATDRQTKALAQVEAAIESTGGAAGVTVGELQEMASALQDVTTFGDEVVLEMQGVLLTFTNLSKDILPETSERVLDVATRMGAGEGGLTEIANSLGKVLNDPIRNLSALSERGIQFTGVQQQMIVELAESGDLLGAQKIILGELEKQFGGAARATRETWGGALDAAKNAAGDFLEQVGEGGLAGALEPAATPTSPPSPPRSTTPPPTRRRPPSASGSPVARGGS